MRTIISDPTIRANALVGGILFLLCGLLASITAFAALTLTAFAVGGMIAALVVAVPSPKDMRLARATAEAERIIAASPVGRVADVTTLSPRAKRMVARAVTEARIERERRTR